MQRFWLSVLSLFLLGCSGSFTNSAQTSDDGSLKPRYYQAAPERVYEAAIEAFDVWDRGVQVLERRYAQGRGEVHGFSQTNLWKFEDDVYVTIAPDNSSVTLAPDNTARMRVDVRSKGRVGEYDFGGNQRNIEEYLSVLDRLLSP